MHKLTATIVLCTGFFAAIGQKKLEYGDFIQWDNKIRWAMETDNFLDLTPKMPKYSITAWYLNKLRTEGINIYKLNNDTYSVTQGRLTHNGWNNNLSVDTINFRQLFRGQESKISVEAVNAAKGNCLCDSCYHPTLFDIIKVKQLIYYKNGRFYISNVLLTPMCLKDSLEYENEFSRWYELLNVAFNNKPDISPTSKMVYIGTVEKSYDLSASNTNSQQKRLLTRQNPGIMNMMYYDLKKGLITPYDPDDKTRKRKLKDVFLRITPEVMIQEYDSLGNVVGTRKIRQEVNTDSIYNFKLSQDVYFDREKEILVSKVKSVTIQAYIITSSGVNLGLGDIATIYYDKAPLNIKKKTVGIRK
jgi:hypothetical protein